MIEEFKYTTVLDSAYMHGLDLMEDRQYKDALVILSDYNDYNTAICLMSLGYDARAAGILESLPESSNVCYLLSILYSRLKDDAKPCPPSCAHWNWTVPKPIAVVLIRKSTG